ncbi:hypothetical protein PCK1_003090 [Pneumocystis canis]|nr:hypothetical protein PCK1_003090 [Pneumocystis canis]
MGQGSSLPNRRQETILQRTDMNNSRHTNYDHNNTTITDTTTSTNHADNDNSENSLSTVSISRVGRFRRHLNAFSRLSGLSPNRHHTSSVSRVPYSISTRRRPIFGSSIPRRNTIFELPQTHFSIASNQLTTTEQLDLHALNHNDYSFSIRDLPLIDISSPGDFIPERITLESSTNTDRPLFRGIIRRSQRNNTLSRNTRRALEMSRRIRADNDTVMQHSFNASGLNAISLRPGEDQATMLSRLLSVAAAATAASLVGNNEQAIAEARDIAISPNSRDGRESHIVDGSFESFLRALQNGRLASALRNGGSENGGGIPNENEETASVQPLNFFRMFRFGNPQGNTHENEDGLQNPRLVPIIIVGIRSVPPRDVTDPNTQHTSPFFDTLANLSVNMPVNYETSYQGGLENQRLNEHDIFPSSSSTHSVSMSETHTSGSTSSVGAGISNGEMIATHLDTIRSFSTSESASENTRLEDQITQLNPNTYTISSLEEPSTQRRSFYLENLFTQRSQSVSENIPENRNTIDNNTSGFNSDNIRRVSVNNNTSEINNNVNRASNSSTDRSRNTSTNRSTSTSNNGRRNSTRSWIIYVLGGSYPEDHPILTTPSLFTDSPTYEDMLLLSSLIGPAKSPVATKDEIESAGGLHVLSVNSSVAHIYLDERCVICLNNYQIGEECRELNKCKHFFHKACIDQWLMTGRNTCPTCRAEGN